MQSTSPDECRTCGRSIDYYRLDKLVDGMKELSADNFNICHECIEIDENTCSLCGGHTFVPVKFQEKDERPTLCPDCRFEVWQETGDDPGWEAEKVPQSSAD